MLTLTLCCARIDFMQLTFQIFPFQQILLLFVAFFHFLLISISLHIISLFHFNVLYLLFQCDLIHFDMFNWIFLIDWCSGNGCRAVSAHTRLPMTNKNPDVFISNDPKSQLFAMFLCVCCWNINCDFFLIGWTAIGGNEIQLEFCSIHLDSRKPSDEIIWLRNVWEEKISFLFGFRSDSF